MWVRVYQHDMVDSSSSDEGGYTIRFINFGKNTIFNKELKIKKCIQQTEAKSY